MVGASGSGKTTLANIVARFFDPQKGRVLIGNTDIRDIPKEALMNKVSFVFQNSRLIQSALSRLIKDKTVLVIAHRMRTVSNADQVVVLSGGTVAEHGTPKELMNSGNIYPHMVNLQRVSYEWGI